MTAADYARKAEEEAWAAARKSGAETDAVQGILHMAAKAATAKRKLAEEGR